MKWVVCAGLALFAGCGSQPIVPLEPQDLERKIDHFSQGLVLKRRAEAQTGQYQNELYSEALEEFKASEKQATHTYVSILNQAECLIYLQRRKEALELANQALSQKPTSSAYSISGLVNLHLNNHDAARYDCSKALDLDASNANALWTRATSYYRERDMPKTLDDVKKYIELRPDEPDGHFFATRAYLLMRLMPENQARQKELTNEICASMKRTLELTDSGKRFRRGEFAPSIDQLRHQYEKFKNQ